MKRVTGIGGIFIKAKDPQVMYSWYQRHLGFTAFLPDQHSIDFPWKDAETGEEAHTYWSLFKETTLTEGGFLGPAPSAAPSIKPGMSATTKLRFSSTRTTPRFGAKVVNG